MHYLKYNLEESSDKVIEFAFLDIFRIVCYDDQAKNFSQAAKMWESKLLANFKREGKKIFVWFWCRSTGIGSQTVISN